MLRYANIFMVVVFLLSVAVQYNDPDGLVWMFAYGMAAGLSLAHVFGRLRWQWSAGVALGTIVWAIMLYPKFSGEISVSELFGSFSMKSSAIEFAREAGGLVIVCVWMTILTVDRLRPGGVAADELDET